MSEPLLALDKVDCSTVSIVYFHHARQHDFFVARMLGNGGGKPTSVGNAKTYPPNITTYLGCVGEFDLQSW